MLFTQHNSMELMICILDCNLLASRIDKAGLGFQAMDQLTIVIVKKSLSNLMFVSGVLKSILLNIKFN